MREEESQSPDEKLNFISRLAHPTAFKRLAFFLSFDTLIIVLSLYGAFLLRFEFDMPPQYWGIFLAALPYFIALKLLAFWHFRLYRMSWSHVGLNDLWNVLNALLVSESVLMALIYIPFPPYLGFLHRAHMAGFPRSIFLIDGILSLIFLAGIRISKRLALEVVMARGGRRGCKRAILVGAGRTAEMVLRDMARNGYSEFCAVAILDDDKTTAGTYLHGVKVLGDTDKLEEAIRKYKAEAVFVAIPSLNFKTLRSIYDSAKKCGVNTIKIIPRIYDFHTPDIKLKDMEEIRIEDLIGRQPVTVDYDDIAKFITGKVVLVTGAGGSIGSEIANQVCAFHPHSAVLLDIDETALHNLRLKLADVRPYMKEQLHFVVGDIKDEARVKEVLANFKPQIAFHAAAYKHVPLMEHNPKEAVKVNVFGTLNLASAAVEHGLEKFILISTDKAVKPSSVMGATKRVAEYICGAFNDRGPTEFVSVRFGNVLGSRGSVLPLFMEQLKRGGPITVTHKDMKRYFMTIPEAVSLVLQASIVGKGGEVIVLDMGEPVKIVDLAEELIRLNGLQPYKDIDIEFIGLRPGEKLYEEILTAEEGIQASRHKKLFIARNNKKYSMGEIRDMVGEFESLLEKSSTDDPDGIKNLLKNYVEHFSELQETGSA